ncbi:unnamed protein product [Diabrotica balteata]|uniref:Protein hunchback n=1 Tax=Diabrotica balteata TaxID=107213 RepID=A0A9N9T3V2_DIABA|nr:unnamed protein product [Diabrotica balteata]
MRGGVSDDMTSTCVQGGIRPIGRYQPNMIMEPSSPQSAWQFHQAMPKREPVDHDGRNDSGLASGGEFVSSSPGSDNSEHFNASYSPPTSCHTVISTSNTFYPTSLRRPSQTQTSLPTHMMYTGDHNPLTPPNSEPMISPKSALSRNNEGEHQTTLTPCTSPGDASVDVTDSGNCDSALKKLQATFEKNAFSECSGDDDTKSDGEPEEYDEQGLRVPKVNSHGKIKTFKCKQCDFVAITKLVFWEHTKLHIKADKLLKCPKCPFVTEYKHHLEYHLRNHYGSKPFKCNQCSYSCVNKSMLNSHLKSHSNIYQYRCSDCSYATKYCHSLKLHLRKYSHKPAMVLNPDGTPNPLPIIDVYGTRRGPKMKSEQKSSEEISPKPEQVLPFPFNQFLPHMQLPFPGFPLFGGFTGAIPNPLLLQNLEKLARERRESMNSSERYSPEQSEQMDTEGDAGVLDLSKPDDSSQTNRRKDSAYKLSTGDNSSEEEDDEATTTMFGNVEVVENKEPEDTSSGKQTPVSAKKDEYSCQYCQINFGDPILYTMHMGYHGYKNPFICNMCGEECNDKVSFFLHIARNPHS